MEMPPPPPWVEGLPQDERGFYILAEAGYLNGKPTFSRNDMDRTVALAINRACALCGFEMVEGHPVYRTFSQGDAADIRMEQSDHTHDTAGPLHLSCALYSSIVCPYLRERTSRLGKASRVNPGGRRGTLAAVMGFENFGLMVLEQLNPNPEAQPPNFMIAFLTLQDDIRYRDGEELLQRYSEAIEQDRPRIDMSKPRHFWGPGEADDMRNAIRGIHEVMRRPPVGNLMYIGSPIPYVTRPL